MANVPISALPALSVVPALALLALVSSGTTQKATAADIVKGGGALLKDGSVAATADLNLGSHKITSLANGTLSTDAVNKGQLDATVAAAALSADGTTIALTGSTLSVKAGGVGTTQLADAGVTLAKLANGTATSVVGRSANIAGVRADIQATVEGHALRLAGGVLSFGLLDFQSSISGTVPIGQLATIATDTLLGRDTTGTGVVEQIGLNATLSFTGTGSLQRAALTGDVTAAAGSNTTAIAAGVIVDADVNAAAAISFTKLQYMATASLLGRDTAGTGPVEEISLNSTLSVTGTGFLQRAALTGDVTAAAGSNTTAIAAGVIVDADVNSAAAIAHTKLAGIATDSLLGRDTAGTGALETIGLNATLSMTGTGSLQRAALTGDVTAAAGSNATTIAANAVTTAKILDGNVTLAKIAAITTDRLLGRDTTGTGVVEEIGLDATLGWTGTGSIQRAALTGDVTAAAGSNTTAIAAGVIVDADINSAAGIAITKLGSIATDTLMGRDTAGTGAIEAITLNATLSFTGTGSIQRAALTGDITAAAGSNTTAIAAGVIVDADVNAAAAIAGTKISPDFGAQNIVTTGQAKFGTTPATAGLIAIPNGSAISARNAANSGNVDLVKLNSSDEIALGGTRLTLGAATADFSSLNLVTTGSLSAGTNPATVGHLRLPNGAGASDGIWYRNGANTGNIPALAVSSGNTVVLGDATATGYTLSSSSGTHTMLVGGSSKLTITTSVTEAFTPTFRFDSSVAGPLITQEGDSTIAVTGQTLTLEAQGVTGTGATVGGTMLVRGGVSTNGTGGSLDLRSGAGPTADGNVNIRSGSTLKLQIRPTVIELLNPLLSFDSTMITPRLEQEDNATNGVTGESLQISAQNCSGTTTTGGDLLLKSGTGTSANGTLRLYNGSTNVLSIFATSAQMSVPSFVFSSTVASPNIGQNTDATATVTGDTFTFNAQDCSGTTSVTAGKLAIRAGNATGGSGTRNGGELELSSGTGATLPGALTLRLGSTTMLQAKDLGSSREVLSLLGSVSTTEMPANTGDRVIFVSDATASPTSGFPTSGGILSVSSTLGLGWKGKNGVETTLAPHGDAANTTKRRWIRWATQPVNSTTTTTTVITAASFDVANFNGQGVTNAVLQVRAHFYATVSPNDAGYTVEAELVAALAVVGGTPFIAPAQRLDTTVVTNDAVTPNASLDVSGTTVRLRLSQNPLAGTLRVFAYLEVSGFET